MFEGDASCAGSGAGAGAGRRPDAAPAAGPAGGWGLEARVLMRVYRRDGRLIDTAGEGDLEGALWVDLVDPSREEEGAVERAFGVDVPTRADMREIEASSRVYEADGVAFLTAAVVSRAETEAPLVSPVTFILTASALITLRHAEPRPFEALVDRLRGRPQRFDSPADLLLVLLDLIVDRAADIIEGLDQSVEAVSQGVFRAEPPTARDLTTVIREIGRQGGLNSKVRESLVTLTRVVTYLRAHGAGFGGDMAVAEEVGRDIRSLTDHQSFVAHKINFLLDATLGLINIQQNSTIRIVSVVALVFLPPTLIASIYGMNFQHMPELAWPLAYPLVLLLIAASALLPWWVFRRKGWF